MKHAALVLAILMAASGAWNTQEAHAESRKIIACKHDKRTVEEMAREDPEYAKTVPKDFLIDQRPAEFSILDSAKVYSLPFENDDSHHYIANIGVKYKDFSVCRVKSRDGTWWLALRDIDGYLEYIIQNKTDVRE